MKSNLQCVFILSQSKWELLRQSIQSQSNLFLYRFSIPALFDKHNFFHIALEEGQHFENNLDEGEFTVYSHTKPEVMKIFEKLWKENVSTKSKLIISTFLFSKFCDYFGKTNSTDERIDEYLENIATNPKLKIEKYLQNRLLNGFGSMYRTLKLKLNETSIRKVETSLIQLSNVILDGLGTFNTLMSSDFVFSRHTPRKKMAAIALHFNYKFTRRLLFTTTPFLHLRNKNN